MVFFVRVWNGSYDLRAICLWGWLIIRFLAFREGTKRGGEGLPVLGSFFVTLYLIFDFNLLNNKFVTPAMYVDNFNGLIVP